MGITRDELIQEIYDTYPYYEFKGSEAEDIADSLIFEGYRKHRVVNTNVQLNDLPSRSVVKELGPEMERVYENWFGRWYGPEMEGACQVHLPVTVLYDPRER